MYDLIEYHIPEAIRIEVTKISSNPLCNDREAVTEVRRFSVDPQITSLSILQSFLVRAFNLQCDFSLSYYRRDLSTSAQIESDVDLDAAYLKSSRPFLQLTLTCQNNVLPDWDIITMSDVSRTQNGASSIANTLFNQVEKFVNKALTNTKTSPTETNSPLTEKQFRNILDAEGRIKCDRELRIAVYRRGIEPGLRKVIWKHLLNVYPKGLNGQQRIDYMKLKSETYLQLKNLWQSNRSEAEVENVLNMVRKDVLRTDRCHHFYSGIGDDDNENVMALLNILTTFALNHKDKYCQGMSDLASPLLYAMRDESHAYICFCALMKRLSGNFDSSGETMSRKFNNLIQLLQYYDSEFYSYLRIHNAHELLFCYRWILLELKREFSFDDALYMLEVLWSSIPPNEQNNGLPLFDEGFRYIPLKIQTKKNEAILRPKFRSEPIPMPESPCRRLQRRVKQLDKLGGAARPRHIRFLPQLLSSDSKDIESPDEEIRHIYSFPPRPLDKQFSVETDDNSSDNTITKESASTDGSINASSSSSNNENRNDTLKDNYDTDNDDFIITLQNVHCNGESIEDSYGCTKEWKVPRGLARSISCDSLKGIQDKSESFSSHTSQESQSNDYGNNNNMSTKSSSCSSLVIISSGSSGYGKSVSLPSPNELGSNDAFMLFLCLTILLQNRDKFMTKGMDGNDIQMYFDGLVRKHNVNSVLDSARQLFHSYLSHWHQDCHL